MPVTPFLFASTLMVSPPPTNVVEALFTAFNRHDVAALEALYAPDARLTSSDFCAPRGRTDIRRVYGGLFETFPDIQDKVEITVASGDRVAVNFVSTSPAKGMRLRIATFLRIRDGKIVEDDSVFDTQGRPCEP